jgi:hydroxyacylglutathione hydrolase
VRPGETADLAAVRWIRGSPDGSPSGDPPLQVVALDDSTFVIRQGKQVHVEAPFLYLLLGTDAALLHDTGATAEAERSPIRRTVDGLLEDRQLRILVTHSQVVPQRCRPS